MSLDYYAGLIADRARIEAFRAGITEQVKPGDLVLEVGSGLGTYAFFAARAGAGKVWGVESNAVAHVAQTLSKIHGLDDVVTLLRGTLPDVEVPEPVDVIIFEDFAIRLLSEQTYRLVRDVTARWLKPGGRVIPGAARLWLAPVGGEGLREKLFPGGEEGFAAAGLDWRTVRPYLANLPRTLALTPEQLLAEPQGGDVMDLLPLPGAAELTLEGSWTVPEATTVEALAFWFDLGLTADAWVFNGPGLPSAWGQNALPIDPPLEVPAGHTMRAQVAPERLPDGAPGWLAWSVECGDEARRGHEFAGDPSSLEDMYPEE